MKPSTELCRGLNELESHQNCEITCEISPGSCPRLIHKELVSLEQLEVVAAETIKSVAWKEPPKPQKAV